MEEQIWKIKIPSNNKTNSRYISLQNPPFFFRVTILQSFLNLKLQVYGVESPQKSGDVQIRCDI